MKLFISLLLELPGVEGVGGEALVGVIHRGGKVGGSVMHRGGERWLVA